MSQPILDILMATYDGERYVREQVESIQAQTFGCWRLLLSDDCSSDGTLNVLRVFAKADPRIELVGEGVRRGGARENFAWLMTQSDAPYVALSDQDDVWLPDKLKRLMAEMRLLEAEAGTATPLLVFSDAKVVDENLNVISGSFADFSKLDPSRHSFANLLANNVAPGFLMMVNRALIDLAASTVSGDGVAIHDWWLMLCASAFGRISYVAEALALYRQHGDNTIGAQSFSVAERASHMKRMDARFAEAISQAGAFLDAYSAKLGEEELAAVTEYAAMADGGAVENVVHLVRSGCWKAGVRKVGQVLAAIRRGCSR